MSANHPLFTGKSAPVPELGIQFQAAMVHAILAGQKTQTRRLVKPAPTVSPFKVAWVGWSIWTWGGHHSWISGHSPAPCLSSTGRYDPAARWGYRYDVGRPLWVRETWRPLEDEDGTPGILFRADSVFRPIVDTQDAADQWVRAFDHGKHGENWRPSILMPRWASRTNLLVTGLRMERLSEISEVEVESEGVRFARLAENTAEYCRLFRTINNLPDAANPFVWVVDFRVVGNTR